MDKKKVISAIMVVFAVLISIIVLSGVANAGVKPDIGRSIGNDTLGRGAIIGETNLSFVNATGVPITEGRIEATWEGGPIIPFKGPFNSHYYEDMLVEGEKYNVRDAGLNTTIYFYRPKLDVKIKDERGKEVSKILQGCNVKFEALTELHIIKGNLPNNISFKLVNPRGIPIWIKNITIDGTGWANTTINTAPLDTGEYKLSVKADPLTNNGLEAEGPSESFTIEKEITITADIKKQAVNKEIIFTVTTTSIFTPVELKVTRGVAANVEFVEFVYKEGVIEKRELGHDILGETDEDGIYKATAYFKKPGIYEITATYIEANNITAATTVEIEEFSATISTNKTRYYTGEHVNITGSANAGDNITIKVDDEIIETDVPIENFSCIWRTAGKQPGSYEIGIWVLPFSDPARDLPDASVTLLLMRGGLSVTVDTEVGALGDEFEIEGIASGRDRVDILTISPKGGSGDGFDPEDIPNAPGLTYSNRSVFLEGEFKEKIRVREDADTGTYLIAVLSYGRDGAWGTSGSDDLIGVLSDYSGSLAVKTQEQILAILKDRTINQPGSDDLLCINRIKVMIPIVELDDVEDVMLGGNLVVSGYTNRKEDSAIIITVEGPVELKPKLAVVEKDGTFNLSFSTVSAKVGEYTVTADDGKGYRDTKTVNVLQTTTPLVSVGNSSGNSSSHSPAPANHASSQSKSEGVNEGRDVSANSILLSRSRMKVEEKIQPGFEIILALSKKVISNSLVFQYHVQSKILGISARKLGSAMIFAIIGLAVAVWLGLKRRRKG
jgi:hypothetical protein